MPLENLNMVGSQDSTVFVTGGSGLIGSHLIKPLVEGGCRVKALYRSNVPDIEGSESVEWVKGDVLDVTMLNDALQGVTHVYHCAAIVSYNPKHKREMFKTNIEGTANIVNASLSAGVEKLCFVSSVAALGKGRKGEVITEETKWSEETSDSNYGKSKYYGELEVWRGVGEGLNAVIVNPSIVIGAGDWNNSSIKIFKTAYAQFPWYTEGVTGFVDVTDVVGGMIRLMASEIAGERFILSAENKTFREVFAAIATAFGKRPPHRKVNSVLAGLVRRIEEIKSIATGRGEPLLTKETAEAALATVRFDNSKIKKYLTDFTFNSIDDAIIRVCLELKERYNLA